MQVLTCDICSRSLRGPAFEFTTLSGGAVAWMDGTTVITNREAARLLQLCGACGDWLQLGMDSVRESFAAAAELQDDPRWLRTG